jgi:hypothetical protein
MSEKSGSKQPEDESLTSDDAVNEPQQLQSAIEKLSEKEPDTVSEFMAMMGTGPMANPLQQKMNGEHITKVLELAADHDERQYDIAKTSQQNESRGATQRMVFYGFVVLVIVGLFSFVMYTFKDQPSVLIPVLSGFGGFVSGLLGGLGISNIKT